MTNLLYVFFLAIFAVNGEWGIRLAVNNHICSSITNLMLLYYEKKLLFISVCSLILFLLV